MGEREPESSLGSHLHLETISRSGLQLHMSFRFDGGLTFTTTIWYDFPLEELDSIYGSSFMEIVYFHCAMFEINKLCSLEPSLKTIELGSWSNYYTERLEELWRIILIKTFGEWRYVNELPNWKGPHLSTTAGVQGNPKLIGPVSITTKDGFTKSLAFCGGGKDSLTSMKLLESIGETYDSLAYSHSIYGQSEPQHHFIDALLDHCTPTKRHKLHIYDSYLGLPFTQLLPNASIKSITAAETPSSIFEALPIVLKYGYTDMILGHEKSANKGNVMWNGEDINHQWGKSYEAQKLLASYISQVLVSNLNYYSTLQPVYDPIMFSMLPRFLPAIPFTQSCNVRKPWCLRCPKCCYVWLCYRAYLPISTIQETFGSENPLDFDENQLYFYQMLGLDKHTPFECIGQPEEVRLAFALCQAKGVTGKAMEMFKDKLALQFEPSLAVAKYFKVYRNEVAYPERFAESLLGELEKHAEIASKNILKTLEK